MIGIKLCMSPAVTSRQVVLLVLLGTDYKSQFQGANQPPLLHTQQMERWLEFTIIGLPRTPPLTSSFLILSLVDMHSYLLDNGVHHVDSVWSLGESLQFATWHGKTISIWEVGFMSGAAPVEVETLSMPTAFVTI